MWLSLFLLSCLVQAASSVSLTVATSSTAQSLVRLGAAEVRRHLTDATSVRPTLATLSSPTSLSTLLSSGPVLLVLNATEALSFAPSSSLPPPSPLGYTLSHPSDDLTLIIGSDSQHTLYGAYAYLEELGFTFTSAGPTVPASSQLNYPATGWEVAATPSFTTRGLQPFHDFAEGPDWWGEDEVKRVTETILSMKGNLIGFHTYPLIEPAVWVGLKEDLAPDGTIANPNNSYSTRWATTHEPGGAWGYNSLDTSKFGFGASQLYEHECFGHESVSGNPALCPQPAPGADSAVLFDKVGALWKSTFAYAVAIGVGTVLGTEMPLAMPPPPAPTPPGPGATLPLQLWYSASRNDHFVTTTPCDECAGLYTLMGTTGWVYAHNETGSTPLCTYAKQLPYGQIDNELRPCTSAAGADAQDYYEGIFTRLDRLLGNTLKYYWSWTPEGWEWDRVPVTSPLIQDAVEDTQKLQAAYNLVKPSFALASCGWTVGPLGARWYYDTKLDPSWTISSIDMDVGNTPVDPAYANITHRPTANKWAIPWSEDDPGLTAPELWVNRSLSHARDAFSYGVGGLLSIHWRTRMTSPQIGSAHAVAWNLSLTTADYWGTWAAGQFGDPTVSTAAAAVFLSIDSYNLPRPVDWTQGPGGFVPGGCGTAPSYAFVDTMLGLRPALLAAITAGTARPAHLERFDYWAGQFVYMRQITVFTCDWEGYNGVIAAIQKITDPAARQAAAIAQGIPARVSLMANFSTLIMDLLATVSTIEGSGTVYNVITHSAWGAVGPGPTSALEALTGSPLPPNAQPPTSFSPARPPQARVQVVRTMLAPGEPLRIRAVVLTSLAQPPTAATLFYRAAGSAGDFASMPLVQAPAEGGVPRFVFTGTLPPQASDFEWYSRFDLPANTTAYTEGIGIPAGTTVTPTGVSCVVPPGGAQEPQSVVIIPQ